MKKVYLFIYVVAPRAVKFCSHFQKYTEVKSFYYFAAVLISYVPLWSQKVTAKIGKSTNNQLGAADLFFGAVP